MDCELDRKGVNLLNGIKKAACVVIVGISLMYVMLGRLLDHVVDVVIPESQCGFRKNRSTVDMIFVARLLQEK